MMTTNEVLRDLLQRIADKEPLLDDLIGEQAKSGEAMAVARLQGKAEGLALAADYIRGYFDHGTPLDEIDETPARNSDPGTSHKAINKLDATTSRGAVALVFYKSKVGYGEDGLTSKGACARAGIDKTHASPWKRVSNLKEAGIVAGTGETRLSDRRREHEVLCITEFGIAEVERLMPEAAAEVRANRLVAS